VGEGNGTNIYGNTHYLLIADDGGYWNATVWVSSTLSTTNDYVQFGLEGNAVQPVPVGTAFIHNSADASCSFTYATSTQTSTITQDVGINSYSGTDVIITAGQMYNSPGGFEQNNALNLEDAFTGVINETPGGPVIITSSMHATGYQQGPNANPVASSDGVALISTTEYPPNVQFPPGWFEASPNSGQTQADPLSEQLYSQGTYQSTSGISDSLSVSVGWAGESAGTTVSILATTTITTTITTTAACAFAYPGNDPTGAGGTPYFYYFTGEPTNPSLKAAIADVWFAGYFCEISGTLRSC